MGLRLALCALLLSAGLFAQTAPCGTAAHCVVLTWNWAQGSGGAATSFLVLRGTTTGGPYTQVGTTPISLLSYTDNSATGNVLTEGATYFYVIEASGPGGNSSNSTEASARIPFLPPVAPTTPVATPH
jgi:hypothetical protein